MIDAVVLQPTTLCNLNCDYCYLPDRSHRKVMRTETARAVATSLRDQEPIGRPVELIWHGGEPLTLGPDIFTELLRQFHDVSAEHIVQTNATLIDDRWVKLFREWDIHVGVSIDGDSLASAQRVDRAGNPAFARIMTGLERLRSEDIGFDVIAVVSDPTPETARRLYGFMVQLGCRSVAVNLEEREGANDRVLRWDGANVRSFWSALADCWLDNPAIEVRELDRIHAYLTASNASTSSRHSRFIDPFPTVAWDGEVTLISPELAGYSSERLGSFSCGNVRDSDLLHLAREGMRAEWMQEFRRGLAGCAAQCPYFSFCEGSHPANRYFETGRLDITETVYCRNAKIALLDGFMEGEAVTEDLRHALSISPRGHKVLQMVERSDGSELPAFDNRPAWDNWTKGKPKTFENKPAWDNWTKTKKKK